MNKNLIKSQGGNRTAKSVANPDQEVDPRERIAAQIRKTNEGFFGTLHANIMHKNEYNKLMNS